MKIGKIAYLTLSISVFLTIPSGCSKKELSENAQKLVGSWAYNHAKNEEVAAFYDDGTAKYDGKKYDFECDDTFIYLTDSEKNETKLRYKIQDDGIDLYKNTKYTYSGEGDADGIIGYWENENNWCYEFSSKGTFLEDGYFSGQYILDKDNKSFKLIYDDQFEDTVCYYSLDGKTLMIDYPWRCVNTVK